MADGTKKNKEKSEKNNYRKRRVTINRESFSKEGFIIESDDSSGSFIYAHKSGNVVQYNTDPTSELLKGLSILSADGNVVNLEIDTATGHPTHLVVDDSIYLFENIREQEGLADLAIIAPDGEIEYLFDLDYQTLLDSQMAQSSTVQSQSFDISYQLSGSNAPSQAPVVDISNIKGKRKAAELGNLGWNLAACTLGAALVVAEKKGVIPDNLFNPRWLEMAGLEGQGVKAQDTLMACGQVMNTINGNINKKKTAVVTPTDVAWDAATDIGGLAADISGAVGSCGVALAGAPLAPVSVAAAVFCIKQVMNVAEIFGSKTLGRALVMYVRARDGLAHLFVFKAYCCYGPTRVEVNSEHSWTAFVIKGSGTLPYHYTFNWGDVTGETLTVPEHSITHTHTYKKAGVYPLKLMVTDSAFIKSDPDPINITVVDELGSVTATCCLGKSRVMPNEEHIWVPKISRGASPYDVIVDWGDGKKNNYIVIDGQEEILARHSYENDGKYDITVEVMDFFSNEADTLSQPFSVNVGEPPEPAMTYTSCTFKVVFKGHYKKVKKSDDETNGEIEYFDRDDSWSRFAADGSFSGNTFAGSFNKFNNEFIGTLNFSVSEDHQTITNLSWTETVDPSSSSPVYRTATGSNIPVHPWYEGTQQPPTFVVSGANTCSHINSVQYSLDSQYSTTTLTGHDCNENSFIQVMCSD